MLWACAGVPLGVYNIVENFNVALRIQPQILTFLSLTTWIQCYYYDKKWSIPKCLALVIPIAGLMGGTQAALIVALRSTPAHPPTQIGKTHSTTQPITLMAILSTVFLSLGVLRHYYDIYAHRTVRGISFIFVGIDAAGDLFSLISVFFEPSLNILGMVIYGTELLLWIGVFACGGYFNFAPWVRVRLSERRRGTEEEELEEDERRGRVSEDDGGAEGRGVALRDLPSSTSVFRTPSAEATVRRSRGGRLSLEGGD
ncbi:MAG: hypothetical protein M1827_006831 [Pycnora praestabilis]|nr:MAG: hypothetical protein M1827_006831 [Pycnora praestabilis]